MKMTAQLKKKGIPATLVKIMVRTEGIDELGIQKIEGFLNMEKYVN